jgi:hypothetical protein
MTSADTMTPVLPETSATEKRGVFASSVLLACPFCNAEKVMAEGSEKRMAMVCQKCLARGPEVNVEEGRDAAIHEWNKALRHPPTPATKWKCERCGMTVAHVWYGTAKRFVWKHIGTKGSRLNKLKTACDRVKPVQANAEPCNDAPKS